MFIIRCEIYAFTHPIPTHANEISHLLLSEIKRGSFGRCRFSRDGSLALYTAVKSAGDSYLLMWRQDSQGEMVLDKLASMGDQAITALEISCDSSLLGLGTSEGAERLLPPYREP